MKSTLLVSLQKNMRGIFFPALFLINSSIHAQQRPYFVAGDNRNKNFQSNLPPSLMPNAHAPQKTTQEMHFTFGQPVAMPPSIIVTPNQPSKPADPIAIYLNNLNPTTPQEYNQKRYPEEYREWLHKKEQGMAVGNAFGEAQAAKPSQQLSPVISVPVVAPQPQQLPQGTSPAHLVQPKAVQPKNLTIVPFFDAKNLPAGSLIVRAASPKKEKPATPLFKPSNERQPLPLSTDTGYSFPHDSSDSFTPVQEGEPVYLLPQLWDKLKGYWSTPVQLQPLPKIYDHATWKSDIAAAQTDEEREKIDDEYRFQKAVERRSQDINLGIEYQLNEERVQKAHFYMTQEGKIRALENEFLKKLSKKEGDTWVALNSALYQARAARRKAEFERDLVAQARLKAPYKWDPADGRVSCIDPLEQAAMQKSLAHIPDNIEEVAAQAAKKVEALKGKFPVYQGANPPDSPNSAERKRRAEEMRVYKEAQEKQKAHVDRMEKLWEEQEREAIFQKERDRKSGKLYVTRFFELASLIAAGYTGTGGSVKIPPFGPMPGKVNPNGTLQANPGMIWNGFTNLRKNVAGVAAYSASFFKGNPRGQKPSEEPKSGGEKKGGPNGKYVNNPKHHINSKNNISKPPQDGQKLLDNAIEISPDHKVSMENGTIFELRRQVEGATRNLDEWHAYEANIPKMQGNVKAILKKAGLFPKKGQ